jgi:hypothetical protein
MTNDVGNPCPGLGQTQECGRVKPVHDPLILITGYKETITKIPHRFASTQKDHILSQK